MLSSAGMDTVTRYRRSPPRHRHSNGSIFKTETLAEQYMEPVMTCEAFATYSPPRAQHLAINSPFSMDATTMSHHGYGLVHPVANPHSSGHFQGSSSIFHLSPSPTPSSTSPSSATETSSLRHEIILEAPTASAQKQDQFSLTYLNKGQFYPVSINDSLCRDCELKTTISIAFHEHPHRQIASNFWKYWICQQSETQAARALDIDLAGSSGIIDSQCDTFDRVTFTWNGRQGAKVFIKFNCLSTDFSRIKGVKGIPLRIATETHVVDNEHHIEKAFCKIKLFRDKGAERKNKDDAKHIERQLEKLRTNCQDKGGDSNPLWLVYMPSQTYTIFSEVPASPEILPSPLEETEFDIPLMDTQCSLDSLPQEEPSPWCLQQPATPAAPSSAELKRRFDEYINPDYSNALDIDKSYVPQPRKRKAVLSFFVCFHPGDPYRAIYLESFTLQDLVTKICSKVNHIERKQVGQVVRSLINRPIEVHVDDAFVSTNIPEEQPMYIKFRLQDDSSYKMILHY
ncbi:hypothetical protein K450DRAFT_234180 [Umbelopsis ramanniana AG]|uniref:Grh/CP2 DB domain-containing protein n=1 Tax=Umbelopsis ramanniana AG TaxID=1314678 RepID=A0AAD5EBR3_UMBRA|nr:uncharacterized protein K450DRAFT_234180 [Umbelopsis ramanniana AG]KAI8581008.1 hypothetical protein K450DRAFT_234180 [Umbelopsis ramanniana AG]